MVDLVETQPQEVDAMTPAVPPIEDKGTYKVREAATHDR